VELDEVSRYPIHKIISCALQLYQKNNSSIRLPERAERNVNHEDNNMNVLEHRSVRGIGAFTLYQNGTVMVHFEDRTIMSLHRECDVADIVTSKAEELRITTSSPVGFRWYLKFHTAA
jgi:hypothetical protein